MSNISEFNVMGIKKWLETDSNGEKYIAYCLGNSTGNDVKSFKYKHMEQLKRIILEFIDYIEEIDGKNKY